MQRDRTYTGLPAPVTGITAWNTWAASQDCRTTGRAYFWISSNSDCRHPVLIRDTLHGKILFFFYVSSKFLRFELISEVFFPVTIHLHHPAPIFAPSHETVVALRATWLSCSWTNPVPLSAVAPFPSWQASAGLLPACQQLSGTGEPNHSSWGWAGKYWTEEKITSLSFLVVFLLQENFRNALTAGQNWALYPQTAILLTGLKQ